MPESSVRAVCAPPSLLFSPPPFQGGGREGGPAPARGSGGGGHPPGPPSRGEERGWGGGVRPFARRRGRWAAGQPPSRPPPFQGGRRETAALRPFVRRRRCRGVLSAPSALLPPYSSLLPPSRGEVGRGVRRRRAGGRRGASPQPPFQGGEERVGRRGAALRPAARPVGGGSTPLPTSPRAIALESPPSLLLPGRGEESGGPFGNALDGRTGRRSAPSSLLPPGRGEVGRGVDPAPQPGRGPSRSRSSVSCLGAPASRRLGGPKARILVRASRDAGGTPALPGVGPPSRPPP